MEQIESYAFHTVTDFHQRRSAMQMFFELDPETQAMLARSWIGEQVTGFERQDMRRALMRRLESKDGDQFFDRIRLAFNQEKARDSKSGRA